MKRTKLQKLVSVYERFSSAIVDVPDQWAKQLYESSARVAITTQDILKKDGSVKPSQLVSGLEQGIREFPDMIILVSDQWQGFVAQALQNAVANEYPEFFKKDSARLDKVLKRGYIKTESEFYLVRYCLEALEGEPNSDGHVSNLRSMVGNYERGA